MKNYDFTLLEIEYHNPAKNNQLRKKVPIKRKLIQAQF
jgi:hypothetical protein